MRALEKFVPEKGISNCNTMSKKIYITRQIPEKGIDMLLEKGYEVAMSDKDRALTKKELIKELKKEPYDAVLSLLTDAVDGEVFDAVPTAKIFANYAVGFNNFNLEDAKKRGVTITNTPSDLIGEVVADHSFALLFAIARRIAEADQFVRKGKYKCWNPMLFVGGDFRGKTLGLLGAGKIGEKMACRARGFGIETIYYDVRRNETLEKEYGAKFFGTVEEVLKQSDFVSLHVPLLDSTYHLTNETRLKMMKPTAYLINTARGPVVDEKALVEALKSGTIAGAGIDVFENEPKLAKGLTKLKNIILTPHIASATLAARDEMATLAAQNIIDFLEGKTPKNKVFN